MESLRAAIADGRHDIDPADFASRLAMMDGWDWGDVQSLIDSGVWTADAIDRAIHAGLR